MTARQTIRQTLRATIAFVLTYLMVWGGVPAPALAEMAEEAMGEEPAPAQVTGRDGARDEGAAAVGDVGLAPMTVEDAADSPSDAELAAEDAATSIELAAVPDEPEAADVSTEAAAEDAGPGLSTQSVGQLYNPRVVANSNMGSGQVVTWDCVWFGSYPQTEVAETAALRNASWADGDATVGGVRYRRLAKSDATDWVYWPYDAGTYRYFRYEPIKWRILKVSGDTALAVTDAALDNRQYHKSAVDGTWETSTVRSWLNGTGAAPYYSEGAQSGRTAQAFATVAFTSEQLGAVRQFRIANADNTYYGTDGGNDTIDRVFLLSLSEVDGSSATTYGFASSYSSSPINEGRKCRPTDFATAMGAPCDIIQNQGYCSWWLRSPGSYASWAAYVGTYGDVGSTSGSFNSDFAVRPALNLDLSSSYLSWAGTVSSDGTVDVSAAPGSSKAVFEITPTPIVRDGVNWSPVYDPTWYAEKNPDVANWARRVGGTIDGDKLLQHFVNNGTKECRSGKAGFDVRSYYNANPDLRAAFSGTADWTKYYRHYATNGSRENRKCTGADQLQGSVNVFNGTNWSVVYDRAYYGQRNSDIVRWATRKCGSATSYYNANSDLRRAFGTDWARYYDHYRGNGQREGRTCAGVGQLRSAATTLENVNWSPVYDANYYAQKNSDVANWARRGFASGSVIDDAALLRHFVNNGAKEIRTSKSSFDVRAYRNKNADLVRAFGNDWKSYYRHYAKFGVNEHRACV